MPLHRYTIAERPELVHKVNEVSPTIWPEFMSHDRVCNTYWSRLFTDLPDYQHVVTGDRDEVVAMAHTIPLAWDGDEGSLPEGWDAAFEQGIRDFDSHTPPTALVGLAVAVVPEYRSRGLGEMLVRTMKTSAASGEFLGPVIPIRPVLKCRYPLVPMERYIAWTCPDGAPFDPWIRLHHKMGARIIRVAPCSMTVTGSVYEWEQWADMAFPESGSYVVPGALSLVEIDRERDLGTYIEPNVWMLHCS